MKEKLKNVIIAVIYNNSCLECGKVEEEMVKIGNITLCNSCFEKSGIEFNKEEYVKLLVKQAEKLKNDADKAYGKID